MIYMCFVDNLLMFCRTDIESVTLLRQIFHKFPITSGLQENLDKSSLYIAAVS